MIFSCITEQLEMRKLIIALLFIMSSNRFKKIRHFDFSQLVQIIDAFWNVLELSKYILFPKSITKK